MSYKNKDKQKEYAKEWRAKNPDYAKKYYKKNSDNIKNKTKKRYEEIKNNEDKSQERKEYEKEWRIKNPEIVKEYKKEWAKENPERVKNIALKRSKKSAEKGRLLKSKVKEYYGCMNPECPCKNKLPSYCLDFHHIKDKKFNIAEVSRYGPKVIQEINKCTILCAVCHRMETCGNLDVSTFKNCNLDEKGNIVP